jgi:hypothetical protein
MWCLGLATQPQPHSQLRWLLVKQRMPRVHRRMRLHPLRMTCCCLATGSPGFANCHPSLEFTCQWSPGLGMHRHGRSAWKAWPLVSQAGASSRRHIPSCCSGSCHKAHMALKSLVNVSRCGRLGPTSSSWFALRRKPYSVKATLADVQPSSATTTAKPNAKEPRGWLRRARTAKPSAHLPPI